MPDASRFRRSWPHIGLAMWSAGALGLGWTSRVGHWTAGETVLAGAAWLLVLALAAREALRNLFGPVFAYEMLRLGRRRFTFFLRFLYALVLVGLLGLLYVSWASSHWDYYGEAKVAPSELAGFAAGVFEALAAVQFAAVALLTPAYVAGTIADEKERRTLEFLLATDLRNREIVFGKLAARVTNLLMYVLAGVPIVAFLQLFGGIDPELALASAGASAVLAVGLSALAMLFSVLCKKPRDAIAFTYAAFFLYLVVSGVAGVLAQELAGQYGALIDVGVRSLDARDLSDWFVVGNPLYTVPVRTDAGRNLDPDTVAGLLRDFALFWGIASSVLLSLAVLRLRPVALKQSGGEAKGGRAAKRAARPEIGDDPIFWREVFTGGGRVGCLGWAFRIALLLAVAGMPAIIAFESFFRDSYYWRGPQTFAEQWKGFRESMTVWVRAATGFLSLLIYFGAALRGAASISGERDRDTWSSLIGAPLSSGEVTRGKFFGAVLGMRFLYAMLVAVWASGLSIGAIHILSLPLAVLHLAMYASAFALLGMLCSATARTTLVASLRGFGVAFFFAGGYWLALLLCCGLPLNMMGADGYDHAAEFAVAFTPPFMTGYFPMADLDRYNADPFYPSDRHPIAPLFPIVGFAVWFGFTLLLAVAVRHRMALAMNRGPKYRKRLF